jgi:HD-like signal output (HDOD) protein
MTHQVEQVRRAVAALQAPMSSLEVVRKAIRAAEDTQRGNLHLEQILLADPGVTARVLRLANSAYFGVSRQVTTVSLAVAVIGHDRLRKLLRHVLVSQVFDELQARRAEALPIWRTSISAGAACYVIARLCRVGDPEELLTIGLLHNVGEFALLAKFPDEYLAVQRMAGGQLSVEGLKVVFGTGAGEVSRWLLDAWSFAPIFGLAAASWRDIPPDSDGSKVIAPEILVVHAAVSVAEAWMQGVEENEAFSRISPRAVSEIHLDEELVSKLYGQLANEIQETEAVLRA